VDFAGIEDENPEKLGIISWYRQILETIHFPNILKMHNEQNHHSMRQTSLIRQKHFPAIKFTLFILLIILGFVLFQTFKPTPQQEFTKSLPQDAAIKVYFNQNPASSYQDPYRHFIRQGDNLEQQFIDAISQAQSTVDLAVMEFRLPLVAEALVAQQKAGVKVRLIIDNNYNKTLADYTSQEIAKMNRHARQAYAELQRYPADALALLRSNGIAIEDDTFSGATKGSGLMHHKFLIVDGKTTLISSGNLTTSDLHGDFNVPASRGNPNNLVVIPDNAQVAQAFTDEFNYMWQGLFKSRKPRRQPLTIPVGTGTMTINFSPASRTKSSSMTSNGIIAYFIHTAKKSIHIAVFVFSDREISDTLAAVHDAGIEDIKVLIDPDFYRQSYSKAYDALGLCPSRQKKKMTEIKPWHRPITTVGFPKATTGDRGVHSKMAILDARKAIAGSHNWSESANYSNDETLAIIDNPTVAAHYEREFNRLYATAILGKASMPQAKACR
jgi:phosphatidylserine/phosphatidylglycerophosphate/cardiolipin synthase-like enzyme